VQSFTARMPLLKATSAFGLGRRHEVLLNSVIYTVSVAVRVRGGDYRGDGGTRPPNILVGGTQR